MKKTVVVLGAGYAGLLAALRIAGAKSLANVVLVNDSDHFVERVRLHQVATGQPIARRTLERMTRGTGIGLSIGRASRLDTAARELEIVTATGTQQLRFDYLVYALGSVGRMSGVPGVVEHAHDVSTEAGADRLRAAVDALPRRAQISVVGGGLTGIETAAELKEARPDLEVRLLAPRVAPDFSDRGREYLANALAELGVVVRERSFVRRVAADRVELEDGGIVASDLTIWCAGFDAAAPLLHGGLSTTRGGRVALHPSLISTTNPVIFGAGDGAAIASREADFIRMSCASAMPMAAHAADNVLRALRHEPLEPFGFAYAWRCVSLGRKRGILQRVTPDDAATDSIVTDRWGARIKEAICRYTTISLWIERVLPGTYTWPGKHRALSISPGLPHASLPTALPADEQEHR